MLSGEEIQRALTAFVARWQGFEGTEKAEAQTFLNQLFECYGSSRRELGAEFEFFVPDVGFMDLHWPGLLLVEMKAPGVPVRMAQQQVERYWRASSDRGSGRPAARWIVTCNFREFSIWEYGRYPDAPVVEFPSRSCPSATTPWPSWQGRTWSPASPGTTRS